MTPRLLALDTATEACSVALIVPGAQYAVSEVMGRGHADAILPMVERVLAEGGTTLAALDGIVASVGPGAFTGVRISVAIAQGLAFGAGLPVVAITTLESLAYRALRPDAAPSPGTAAQADATRADGARADAALVCLDARMQQVYWGCFRRDAQRGVASCAPCAVGSPESVASADFAAVMTMTGIGRGFGAYPRLRELPGLDLPTGFEDALPDARDFLQLGAVRYRGGERLDPAQLTPCYLRDQVALTEAERRMQVMELSHTRALIAPRRTKGTRDT